MLLPLFDALQVQHDPALRLLRFQWLDAGNHHLRPALVHGRELVVTHQPRLVLVDMTSLPPLSVADELWMSVSWLPRIAAQPLQEVALVLPPGRIHNQMATETLLWVGRHLVRFQLQVFEETHSALDWLTSGDAAVAARLRAEWVAAGPPGRLPT